MNISGRPLLAFTTKQPPMSSTDQGGGKRRGEVILPGSAKGKAGLVAPSCLLSPFPLAGLLVVVGKTALNHFVAPLIARHDEGSETAAAEAKRAERHHNAELQ